MIIKGLKLGWHPVLLDSYLLYHNWEAGKLDLHVTSKVLNLNLYLLLQKNSSSLFSSLILEEYFYVKLHHKNE